MALASHSLYSHAGSTTVFCGATMRPSSLLAQHCSPVVGRRLLLKKLEHSPCHHADNTIVSLAQTIPLASWPSLCCSQMAEMSLHSPFAHADSTTASLEPTTPRPSWQSLHCSRRARMLHSPCHHADSTTAFSVLTTLLAIWQSQNCSQTAEMLLHSPFSHADNTTAS